MGKKQYQGNHGASKRGYGKNEGNEGGNGNSQPDTDSQMIFTMMSHLQK